MLVRREAIDQVGVMDDGFFMYGEETDWCWRFRKAGWRVLFAPVGQIIHLGGQSSKRVRSEMIIALRMSILRFIRKHQGRLAHGAACILVAAFFLARVPYWGAAGLFGSSERESAKARVKAYWRGAREALKMLISPLQEKKAI
jgi:GT2 family glycosyltransferase